MYEALQKNTIISRQNRKKNVKILKNTAWITQNKQGNGVSPQNSPYI
jgi:hypothetical protein